MARLTAAKVLIGASDATELSGRARFRSFARKLRCHISFLALLLTTTGREGDVRSRCVGPGSSLCPSAAAAVTVAHWGQDPSAFCVLPAFLPRPPPLRPFFFPLPASAALDVVRKGVNEAYGFEFASHNCVGGTSAELANVSHALRAWQNASGVL